MFGLKRKQHQSRPQDLTFLERVEQFWPWFEQNAARFYKTIDEGRATELVDEVSGYMNQTLPHMSWVFGPGESGGHSFTVTGEGVVAKQLLAERWFRDAIEVPGWDFHWSRHPSTPERLADVVIGLSESESVSLSEVQVLTTPDEEQEKFTLLAWHPLLAKLPEQDQHTIIFLLLDEALGEFGVKQWLGEIKIESFDTGNLPEQTKLMSLAELPGFVEQAFRYHQWEKISPLQSYSLYQLREQAAGPRGDTIAGTTLIPHEVLDYIAGRQADESLLEGTGAELAYVRLDSTNLPSGQETDTRANIENALDEALGGNGSGRTLGGAVGVNQTYIDLVLFDGHRSRETVQKTLDSLHLKGDFAIESLE